MEETEACDKRTYLHLWQARKKKILAEYLLK